MERQLRVHVCLIMINLYISQLCCEIARNIVCMILSRRGRRPSRLSITRYFTRFSRIIIVLIVNDLITNLSFKVFESFRQDFLQFSLPRLTKLRISQNIRYIRITNIESNMTIFGKFYNLLNTKCTCTVCTCIKQSHPDIFR